MIIINLTPHDINLNDGTMFPASGDVARVEARLEMVRDRDTALPEFTQTFGEVTGLPEAQPDTIYIVSAMVLSALGGSRRDVRAPATGHPDTVRTEKGHIISVPGLIRPQ